MSIEQITTPTSPTASRLRLVKRSQPLTRPLWLWRFWPGYRVLEHPLATLWGVIERSFAGKVGKFGFWWVVGLAMLLMVVVR